MIDPVELKALVEKYDAADGDVRPFRVVSKLANMSPDLARQVLALSEEVERLKEEAHQAFKIAVGHQDRATAAESEAQALRERMGEIREIAATVDRAYGEDSNTHTSFTRRIALDRIAALSTTPKEKEGCESRSTIQKSRSVRAVVSAATR